ncbi:MAG: putative sugar O-methyltransferase [Treponema sp.]|nr:putative sugar O-methyltransferase [Treponema sp.]
MALDIKKSNDDFKQKLLVKKLSNRISADRKQTSISDDKLYPAFCELAAENSKLFEKFRQNPIYKTVLEHVSEYQGSELLWHIFLNEGGGKFNKENWDNFKLNDKIGSPAMYDYSKWFNNYGNVAGKQTISPTTIRYVKVLQDIIRIFNKEKLSKIAEIGIGYGGQARIISSYIQNVNTYYLFDLPEVLKLANKYVSAIESYSNGSTTKFVYIDGTTDFQDIDLDFVISNYAFSELTRPVQDIYLNKVILKAKKGYITWNELSHKHFGGYSLNELLEIIPNSVVIEEKPLSYINNNIIIWGSDAEIC